jgi:hypothetical protein
LLYVPQYFPAGKPHESARESDEADAALAHQGVNGPLAHAEHLGDLGLGEKFRLSYLARAGGGLGFVCHGNRRWPAALERRMRVVRFTGSYRLSAASCGCRCASMH